MTIVACCRLCCEGPCETAAAERRAWEMRNGPTIGVWLETPATIAKWAEDTFGPHTHALAGVNRVQAELNELFAAAGAVPQDHAKITNEVADVLITVYRYAYSMGIDIHEAVAAKMAVNRARLWKRNGDGTGQHIKHDRLDCT